MSENEDLVLREVDDGVATLTLNRPERKNAWAADLEHRYYERLREADADREVRVIVVTAAGTTFCPGVDSERLKSVAKSGSKDLGLGARPAMTFPLTIRKPLIAAINGSAAGQGLLQLLNCDVRFCSSRAKFSTAFAKRGLPAEHASSWLLPRIIGVENALDLLLSSRVIDAAEAKSMGLVSRVLEPDEVLPAAQAYAAEMARSCSPRSLAAIRRQVYGDLSRGLTESWIQAYGLTKELAAGEDFSEGVASYLEKREPRFASLDDGFQVPGDMGY